MPPKYSNFNRLYIRKMSTETLIQDDEQNQENLIQSQIQTNQQEEFGDELVEERQPLLQQRGAFSLGLLSLVIF